MNYLRVGLALLIPSTLIGIYTLGMNQLTENSGVGFMPLFHFSIINGTVWIIGIFLTIKGMNNNNNEKSHKRKRRMQNRVNFEKNEDEKKLNQENEFKTLKEKVEELERNKKERE